jgi:hypothetical protein
MIAYKRLHLRMNLSSSGVFVICRWNKEYVSCTSFRFATIHLHFFHVNVVLEGRWLDFVAWCRLEDRVGRYAR